LIQLLPTLLWRFACTHPASCIALPQLPPLGDLCVLRTRSGHRNGLQLEIARSTCATASDTPDCYLSFDNAQHVWPWSMLKASCKPASHCSKPCPAYTLQLWFRKVTETESRESMQGCDSWSHPTHAAGGAYHCLPGRSRDGSPAAQQYKQHK